MWRPFCYVFLPIGNLFHHVRAFSATFFFYGGPFLPCGGIFVTFFSMWWAFFVFIGEPFCPYREPFWACQPSLRKFLRAPMPPPVQTLMLPPSGRPCHPFPPPHSCEAPMQTHSICILHVSSINYTVGHFLKYV